MTATVSNRGNSQGLRFPKAIMNVLNLVIGDKIKISIKNKKIILEPIKQLREKYNINDLVKKIPHTYKTYEEFDKKIGLEEW